MRLPAVYRSRLLRKYVVYFVALVGVTLIASGTSGLFFAYQENRSALLALQREKALGAAAHIDRYIGEIVRQIGWIGLTQRTSSLDLEQLRIEYLKLLRQVPAITEVSHWDESGHEQLRISRLESDVIDSGKDYSQHPGFRQTRNTQTYYGPVYYRRESEPYVTIALSSGTRPPGVTIAEVNLRFVWDVVSNIKIGEAGYAYVVDRQGRLISHPDISEVLRQTNYSDLSQVREALSTVTASKLDSAQSAPATAAAHDHENVPVLTAYSEIAPLGWLVFVEQPQSEAFAPLQKLVTRTGLLLLFGLLLAVWASFTLARRMVTPIRALQAGAARIGHGALNQRIDIHTGDELESLGAQFNQMAADLEESYAGLERKVEERTRELEQANQAKSRFLAAASHDLRQPMHALGLFISQLRGKVDSTETRKLVEQAQSSVAALGTLFDALLDISKLDAGVLKSNIEDVAINPLLQRMAEDFGSDATEKGLRLRIVPSKLYVRSDAVLLERILLNLVGNAVRYTANGRVLLGCRRRGDKVRIEVWDTGCGVSEDQHEAIFDEFSQLGNPERDRDKGLGLGLAIVRRLALLLGHRIELTSAMGKGSVFSVEVPLGEAPREARLTTTRSMFNDHVSGTFIVVVEDDLLVQQGMLGLLQDWGCHVIVAAGSAAALAELEEHERLPDAIVSDYRLPAETGREAIARLREDIGEAIPAVLISGDAGTEVVRDAADAGYPLLRKPVQPARLRALLSEMLATNAAAATAND